MYLDRAQETRGSGRAVPSCPRPPPLAARLLGREWPGHCASKARLLLAAAWVWSASCTVIPSFVLVL